MISTRHLVLPVLAASGLVLGLTALPASAAVIDADTVLIQGGVADFGNPPHGGVAPAAPGRLTWDYSPTSAQRVTAQLTGTVFRDGTQPGACARVRMQLFNASNALIGSTASAAACAGDNGRASRPVSLVLAAPGSHRMVVTTQQQPSSGGPFVNTGTQTRFFGQLNGNPAQD